MRCHVSDVEIRAAGDRGRREQQGGCQCENNKHREKPRIESADESPRTARLKCIRLVAEPSVSARWISSNYRGIQPIVTRFPPRTMADCLKRAECKRRVKKRRKKGRDKEERRGCSTKKAKSRDGWKSKRSDSDGYPQRRHLETVDGRLKGRVVDEIENRK